MDGKINQVVEPENQEEILKKYDSESRFRDRLAPQFQWLWKIIAAGMSFFHLYMAGFGGLPVSHQRIVHLGFAMTLVFLLYPARKKSPKDRFSIPDLCFAVLSIFVNGYMFLNVDMIALRAGEVLPIETVFGILIVLLLFEAARRCLGIGLPVIAFLFLCYAYLGPYFPGRLQHRGYTLERIISQIYSSSEGIYGVSLGVSSTYIFLFILFGAFLGATGLSILFNSFSIKVAGKSAGGPAKVSIFASGLLGMINGSAPANVVTTGAFTIPLMRRIGYSSEFAASVEAIASTGGQIMPPVMGAAAFIMAEFLGVPYKEIIIAAIIPAILYYASLWINVDLRAKRLGLRGMTEDELPNLKLDFARYWHLLLPVVLLLVLIFANFTPYFAGFYSIVAMIVVSMCRKSTRLTARQLFECLATGARSAVSVAVATAIVGVVVGVISLTGLGMQLSGMIVRLTSGAVFPTLILAMLACLILGMGLPTSAAYIVAGTVVAPVLLKLGIPPLIAHFFVFYFAIISVVTPPVAVASYAAAGMAGASPTKVGWTAMSLGLVAFIVPYMFINAPGLLFQGALWQVLLNFVTASVGVFCLGVTVQGYWKTNAAPVVRLLCLVSSLLFIDGGWLTDLIGLGLFIAVYLVQKMKKKTGQEAAG